MCLSGIEFTAQIVATHVLPSVSGIPSLRNEYQCKSGKNLNVGGGEAVGQERVLDVNAKPSPYWGWGKRNNKCCGNLINGSFITLSALVRLLFLISLLRSPMKIRRFPPPKKTLVYCATRTAQNAHIYFTFTTHLPRSILPKVHNNP